MANSIVYAKVFAMSNPTPTRLLMEQQLGEPLDGRVAALRRDGKSWNAIALALYEATGTHVTSETLRNWFPVAKSHAA